MEQNAKNNFVCRLYMKFKHLEEKQQTYFEHFKDSMSYAGRSLKSFGYFFIHAFLPDTFTSSGSESIKSLNFDIIKKSQFLETTNNRF